MVKTKFEAMNHKIRTLKPWLEDAGESGSGVFGRPSVRIVQMSHSENTGWGHLTLKEGQRSSLEVALKWSGNCMDAGSERGKII